MLFEDKDCIGGFLHTNYPDRKLMEKTLIYYHKKFLPEQMKH